MKVKDFDLRQTLECGQCFNFERIAENDYIVVAKGRMLHVSQFEDELRFEGADEDEVSTVWIPYFDLQRDYGEIKSSVAKADERLAPVVEKYHGIRLLNQDFPETLISFIISQNKSIPQIKRIVRNICSSYGNYAGSFSGRDYYSFPDAESRHLLTEDVFRELKCGFRAPYLADGIRWLREGAAAFGGEEGFEKRLRAMTFEQARNELMSIRGVGEKVASCVMLFSLGFREAFPVDVWIKRIMEEMYFSRKASRTEIENLAAEKFGVFGGYAQQYLFIHARENAGIMKKM
ncbi:MAG: DNA-3-methyladenine glycosylase family protein [Lachnospiraceae bacterium]|jgi:N-glycosylase/DNA lyase